MKIFHAVLLWLGVVCLSLLIYLALSKQKIKRKTFQGFILSRFVDNHGFWDWPHDAIKRFGREGNKFYGVDYDGNRIMIDGDFEIYFGSLERQVTQQPPVTTVVAIPDGTSSIGWFENLK